MVFVQRLVYICFWAWPIRGVVNMSWRATQTWRYSVLLGGGALLVALVLAMGGCGGGSSGKEPLPDPTPVPTPQPLTLSAPVINGALIAGMRRELQLGYSYDPALIGDDLVEVRFLLEAAPMGMTLFEDTGTLLWTPSPALEGSQHTVRVRAALGGATADVTFTVSVALSTPVATSVVGNTVTVAQPGSLQGFAITVPDRASRSASQLQVRVIDEAQAPPLPDGAVRLSDFFVVSPVTVDEGAMIVSLPSALVPPGMHVEDLSLFTYDQAIEFGVLDPDVDSGPSDSASWAAIGSNFEIAADALRFQVGALGALSFVGYYPDPDAITGLGGAWDPEFRALTALEPLANGSRCQRQARPDLSESVRIWECEADGLRLQIRRLAPINWSAGLTPDDILGWALEARAKIRGLKMDADDRIGVSIEPLASALGQWRPSTPNMLYLRNSQPDMFELTRAEVAKHVLAHEFFHHAQFRTRVDMRGNMIAFMVSGEVPKARIVWALEGTAVWFEDEVYDASNRYRRYVPAEGLPLFLRGPRGLGVVHKEIEAYQYFAWWKMLKSHCTGWSLREVFNVEAGDPAGVRSLANSINSADWQCRFAPGFESAGGPSHRLAGALLYYALATDNDTAQHRNGLALLDADEPQIKFQPNLMFTLTPSAQCGELSANWFETCPVNARMTGRLAAYRVTKFKLNATDSGSDARSLRIRNGGSMSDLYVLALQDVWPTEGWPKHAGWRVRPNETVTISGTDLGVDDSGTWSLWVVNPSNTTSQVALAAGLLPAAEPTPSSVSFQDMWGVYTVTLTFPEGQAHGFRIIDDTQVYNTDELVEVLLPAYPTDPNAWPVNTIPVQLAVSGAEFQSWLFYSNISKSDWTRRVLITDMTDQVQSLSGGRYYFVVIRPATGPDRTVAFRLVGTALP